MLELNDYKDYIPFCVVGLPHTLVFHLHEYQLSHEPLSSNNQDKVENPHTPLRAGKLPHDKEEAKLLHNK